MQTIVLYLSIMSACYILAYKLVKNREKFNIISKFTTAAVYLLIFTMGLRIGANEEVISNLGSIGLQAFLTVIMAIAGSMLVSAIVRRIAGLDRYGLSISSEGTDTETNNHDSALEGLKSSGITLLDAVSGMVAGYLLIPVLFSDVNDFQSMSGTLIDILLCILLGSIGFDLGLDGDIVSKFRTIGLRILLLPLCIIVGTFAAGAVYGLFSGFSTKESIAIFAGMGWYSFAPVVIMNAGYIEASAVSFLHNIFREILSLIFVPVVAKKLGYFEAASMPASPGMDICLPVVERSTNGEMVIYSLISGIIISIMIPIWMPLIIGA